MTAQPKNLTRTNLDSLASRAWIPNRYRVPLDAVERLAESADRRRMREAARETGNWSLLNTLAALADEARCRKTMKNGKRA